MKKKCNHIFRSSSPRCQLFKVVGNQNSLNVFGNLFQIGQLKIDSVAQFGGEIMKSDIREIIAHQLSILMKKKEKNSKLISNLLELGQQRADALQRLRDGFIAILQEGAVDKFVDRFKVKSFE